MKKSIFALAALVAAGSANAMVAGDIMFTAFNADEDGLAFVTFVDMAANTTIYFADNEWNGSAFNSGESYNVWNSGASVIAAGTVVRFSAYDKPTLSASHGTLARETVSGNTNWGIANSNETVYAYLGTSATAPTTFLTAITNGTFTENGPLTDTGLVEGVTAIRLNTLVPSASPDFAEYTGDRISQVSFDDYKPLLANSANWFVDAISGTYTTTVPDTSVFIASIPEADTYLMMLSGLGLLGFSARRKLAA